jgi:hypothetical protein
MTTDEGLEMLHIKWENRDGIAHVHDIYDENRLQSKGTRTFVYVDELFKASGFKASKPWKSSVSFSSGCWSPSSSGPSSGHRRLQCT